MEIRNFAIIAHIDHGKSTLADRMLEITGVVKPGSGAQLLDTMELEKERGITIKLNPARMQYKFQDKDYQLNLIDTPGHVDFTYEVSRSLEAVDGVVLLIDASQGVQAQTLSNLHLAEKSGLTIIPAINKIDLPTAQVEETIEQIVSLLACRREDICLVSGKTGQGVSDLLNKVVTKIPSPQKNIEPTRALVFDSFFDSYLGVVAYVKVESGQISRNRRFQMSATKAQFDCIEVGYLQLKKVKSDHLSTGEIGYLATGLKTIQDCRVGDTIIIANSDVEPLPGYTTPRPMVYASFFPDAGRERDLAVALDKLRLTDASLVYEPINSKALGLGYTIGFLGLLHLEIIKERIEREYDITVLVTTPTVAYLNLNTSDQQEPWVELEIVSPQRFFGQVSELVSQYRNEFVGVEYFSDRVICRYNAPLADIIADFYDRLKSASSGYASMDYHLQGYRLADLVPVDLLVAGEKIDALTQYMVRSKAERYGRQLVDKLKNLVPRQNFEVSLQASIGGKIIARADVPAFRKDVTAKLYGGDVTRKNKLLEKQKKGKKRMRHLGRIEIPSEVFVELLKKN